MLLKTHLDIISRNEPIQRKARFWQSYMRALKGTDDMRAPECSSRPRSIFRPLLSEFPEYSSRLDSWPYTKSIYDDPIQAHDRISTPGYRYQPISRETYGYYPRTNLSKDFHYRPDKGADLYAPGKEYEPDWDYNKGWDLPKASDFLEPEKTKLYDTDRAKLRPSGDWDLSKAYWDARLANIDIRYPRATSEDRIPYALHHATPTRPRSPYRASSVPPSYRSSSLPPSSRYSPRDARPVIGYTYAGTPIYSRTLPMYDLLNPSPYMPMSRIVRDPWWWDYPSLRPYSSTYTSPYYSPYSYRSYPYSWRSSPYYLRNSYLSPVKNTYLWSHHPARPL